MTLRHGLVIGVTLASCTALASCAVTPQAGDSVTKRAALTHAALMEDAYYGEVDLSAFARPDDASSPSHVFEGTLQLSGNPRTRTIFSKAGYLSPEQRRAARTFPNDFSYDFVQAGDVLLPIRRGYIVTEHPYWDFVLEPGRVWDETGDHGLSRAVLPFALVQKHMNCTHFGLMSFLFGNHGVISQVAMQISSETCNYLQFDMWGLLDARYTAHPVTSGSAATADYRRNQGLRLPTRPIARLASDYPQLDPAAFAIGESYASSLHGLVIDGIHYVSSCPTRHGDYPYCDVLPFPSYSVAKSAAAALALMAMEQRHPGSQSLGIDAFAPVPGCATPKWRGVTLRHLLDMTTGHFDSTGYMNDESSPKVQHFFYAIGEHAKARFACTAYPRQTSPGETWVYHTSDTFLLGDVLDRYLQNISDNEGADVFRDVLDADIYGPLGLSATARSTRRTADARALPLFGYGLQFHRDDLARLALFIGRDHGKINEQQVLDAHLLKQALQLIEGARGSVVSGFPDFRYQLGFWARDVAPPAGCKSSSWVPFMSGFGGISVVLYPKGVVYYNVSDSGSAAAFDWSSTARELSGVLDLCREE